MKKIILTQGKVALVDDKDFEYLVNWTWYYSIRGYAELYERGKTIRMHRVVLERKLGHSDFEDTDHINGDSLDNQRDNLRPATHVQNSYNRGKNKNNTSGYKGVDQYAQTGKWRARIQVNGKNTCLGYFYNKIIAARAYDRAAIKYHGEFICLNFPRSDYVS